MWPRVKDTQPPFIHTNVHEHEVLLSVYFQEHPRPKYETILLQKRQKKHKNKKKKKKSEVGKKYLSFDCVGPKFSQTCV